MATKKPEPPQASIAASSDGTGPLANLHGATNLADWLLKHASPAVLNNGDGINVAAIPQAITLHSLKKFADEYRTAPEFRHGSAFLQDLDSLIAHVNRFKDSDSALFFDRGNGETAPDKTRAPQMIGVIDYHCAGADPDHDRARFGKHRAHYRFPLAAEWQAWTERNAKPMTQGEFAEFIEDRIVDVLPPPDFVHADFDRDKPLQQLQEFAKLFNAEFAGPSALVTLSRGLAVRAHDQVKNALNLATGEVQIQYETTHRDANNEPLKVPSLFLIGIPVFRAGAIYRIPVRLRYRLGAGVIKWFYELYRVDRVLDDAFDGACQRAAKETGLPLFRGIPEAPAA